MRGLLVIALVVVALGAVASRVAADAPAYRVIVNAKEAATKLDRRFVSDAFLKKRTRWDDDRAIFPVDQRQDATVREVVLARRARPRHRVGAALLGAARVLGARRAAAGASSPTPTSSSTSPATRAR